MAMIPAAARGRFKAGFKGFKGFEGFEGFKGFRMPIDRQV